MPAFSLSPKRAGASVLVFCGLAALAPALAQPAATADAPDPARVQSQLRAWFTTLLAPVMTLPEPPLTVTRDGATYRFSLPASVWSGAPGDSVSAELRPLDGGAWSIEKLNVPPKGHILASIPNPPGPPETFDTRYQLREQTVRGVIDPEMRRRSSVSIAAHDVVLDMRSSGQKQLQRLDRYDFQVNVIPGADGRFDMAQDATMTGWETTTEFAPDTQAAMSMRRGRMAMRLHGVRSDQLGTAFTTLKELIAEALPTGNASAGALTAATRVKLRRLIEAFRGMGDRMEAEETLDDLIVAIPLVGKVSLAQFAFGMGAEAPDGRLRAWTELSMQGLTSDVIPPAMRDYVPSRIALRPVLSGVPTEKLFSLLLRAIEEKADFAALQTEATALLASADTMIWLESLAVDLDPVKLSGSGRLRLFRNTQSNAKQASPDQVGIEAQLVATGLDTLMADMNKKPDLRAFVPIVAMARGMARAEGDRLVWDLVLTENQALVNGVDLFLAMQPPPDPKPQQRPNKR